METIGHLCDFLEKSRTHYHAAAQVAGWLQAAGYVRLEEGRSWDLVPGGRYYIQRHASALAAFRIPASAPTGAMIAAAHCDRPGFLVKENGLLEGKYLRLATERYGGLLMYSWLDRPLSIAGRVLVKTRQGVESRLVDLDQDLALIPSVAIHMDRTVNDGKKFDPAVDTLPLIGLPGGEKLEALLQEAAGGEIAGRDMYLYLREKPRVWGLNGEFLSAQGLDDLECVWACAQGFLNAGDSAAMPVLCVFDSEEVGSCSSQGADGTLLSGLLSRICRCLGVEEEVLLSNSFMVSADNAHALHPNHPELADPTNAPVLNGGVVIKTNANLSYTTTGLSAALFRQVCEEAQVPVQTYYNRANIPGGSTLGRISLGHVSVPSVDIGLAQLAMHSCYETGAAADAVYLEEAMTAYYGAALEVQGDSWRLF